VRVACAVLPPWLMCGNLCKASTGGMQWWRMPLQPCSGLLRVLSLEQQACVPWLGVARKQTVCLPFEKPTRLVCCLSVWLCVCQAGPVCILLVRFCMQPACTAAVHEHHVASRHVECYVMLRCRGLTSTSHLSALPQHCCLSIKQAQRLQLLLQLDCCS
jgi:hypothetical protein